jgi:predicted PurR-regulated permease PerM
LGVTEATVTEALSGEKLASLLVAILGGVVSFAGDLLFGLVLVAFLLIDFKRLLNLATSELSGRPFFGKLPEIAQTAVTYFGVRTRLNLVTGLGVGVLLLILGVDYALLWGAMAFMLSYVPYVGLFVAMVPPTILAFAEHGLGMAAVVAIGAVVVNLAIENIVEPRLTGKTLKLSPVVVLVSFFFWGWLLGSTGALLSMPIMVMIMLVTAEDERTRWIARIIGSEEG